MPGCAAVYSRYRPGGKCRQYWRVGRASCQGVREPKRTRHGVLRSGADVADLVRDTVLLLLQQVNRLCPSIVGLKQFHPLVIEPVTFAREARKFFRLVCQEHV